MPQSSLMALLKLAKSKNKQSEITSDRVKPYLNASIILNTVKKDEYITMADTPTRYVYYVLTGAFTIKRGSSAGKNTVKTQVAPSFLGVDYAVLSYDGYYPEIQALEDCMILKMERNYFLKSIKQDGELCFEVLHEICGKFFGASLRSDQKYFYDSSTRLMIYIINYWLSKHGNADKISIEVPNNDIAEELGISVRTFYRTLSKFKEQNLISTVSGNISVTKAQIKSMETFLQGYEDMDTLLSLYK